MDHNIIIFTLIVFASMIMLLRFVSALIYPFLLLMGALFAFYTIKKMFAAARDRNGGFDCAVEEREEGLSLKYSKIIIKLRKKFAEIKGSFMGDKAAEPLLEGIDGILSALVDENIELGRRASRMEQYMATIDVNELRIKKAEYLAGIRGGTDETLRAEYVKSLSMIDETISSYEAGERIIKLIDLEMARSGNYFDIVKMKIANLCVLKNGPAKMEIDEICAEINKLFDDIKKLKNNFSQIIDYK